MSVSMNQRIHFYETTNAGVKWSPEKIEANILSLSPIHGGAVVHLYTLQKRGLTSRMLSLCTPRTLEALVDQINNTQKHIENLIPLASVEILEPLLMSRDLRNSMMNVSNVIHQLFLSIQHNNGAANDAATLIARLAKECKPEIREAKNLAILFDLMQTRRLPWQLRALDDVTLAIAWPY